MITAFDTCSAMRAASGKSATTTNTRGFPRNEHVLPFTATQLPSRRRNRPLSTHINAVARPSKEGSSFNSSRSPFTATPEAPSTSSAASTKSTDNPIEEDVLIEFKDVYKSFGSKHILKGASFKIRRGEAVGIIGSSGTGKSTTLRLAAGLLQPDKGEVLIMGEPRRGLVSDDDTSNKLKLGLVFQSGALFDSLKVRENVGFMLYEHTDLPPALIEERVAASLAMVGLSGVEDLYPSELSGGMKKRVALARAIVTDGTDDQVEQLIMYDEPTAGLDPVASTVVEDLIRGMHVKPSHQSKTHSMNNNGSSSSSSSSSNGINNDDDGGSFFDSWNATTASSSSNSTTTAVATREPEVAAVKTGSSSIEHKGISSYVVVTHQHSTIRRAVDRIIFLHGGKVVWEGTVKEFDETDEPIVRQFASGSLDGPIVYV